MNKKDQQEINIYLPTQPVSDIMIVIPFIGVQLADISRRLSLIQVNIVEDPTGDSIRANQLRIADLSHSLDILTQSLLLGGGELPN